MTPVHLTRKTRDPMDPRLPVSRWPSKGVLALIRAYKLTLSPYVGRDCRYLPTCSAYAADAVRAHGAWAGSWMAAARLCRCHPWGGKGFDPAPAVAHAPWWAPWRFGDWAWGARRGNDRHESSKNIP